ncbi:hypothetical protein [Massilia pseudoviolaceinigra]|uniref:hypothetical protein n=1 Tax=Massilia pseudoviolaceinigra TaxID=3057165 RepID=UPI002796DEA4|nr:hypothetical protein [Massilia sp. CCM 9206]MDQ1920710.1 hypothetical protein [Massilia sp. CCM 9206]
MIILIKICRIYAFFRFMEVDNGDPEATLEHHHVLNASSTTELVMEEAIKARRTRLR